MRPLNSKGIALITALMMTLIILCIILGVVSLINESIKGTAAQKTYRNAVEASYGGADVVVKSIIPKLFDNITTSTIKSSFSSISMEFGSSACLKQKMHTDISQWSACSGLDTNPKFNPDLTFRLSGVSGQSFTVYSKIIDTMQGAPYVGGSTTVPLLGAGVAEPSTGTTVTLPHFVYRVEVQGERTANPAEKGIVSVLYEF